MSKSILNKIHVGHIKTPGVKESGINVCKSGFGKVIGISTSMGKRGGALLGIKWNDSQKKIFGIGLGKTGTTTLAACLVHLGFNHQGYSSELARANFEGGKDVLYESINKSDSFDDFPWPLIYKELYAKYPDAKFILTTRTTPEIWYDSLKTHYLKSLNSTVNVWVYAYGDLKIDQEKEKLMDMYDRHLSEVRKFFSDKPNRMLEACWENGDGWPQLCAFLNFDVPNIPFPHANKRSQFQKG